MIGIFSTPEAAEEAINNRIPPAQLIAWPIDHYIPVVERIVKEIE